MDWAKTTARGDEKHLSFEIWCDLYKRFYGKLGLGVSNSSFYDLLDQKIHDYQNFYPYHRSNKQISYLIIINSLIIRKS